MPTADESVGVAKLMVKPTTSCIVYSGEYWIGGEAIMNSRSLVIIFVLSLYLTEIGKPRDIKRFNTCSINIVETLLILCQ